PRPVRWFRGPPRPPAAPARMADAGTQEHDPEKWIPVFGQDHAQLTSHEADMFCPSSRFTPARRPPPGGNWRSPMPAFVRAACAAALVLLLAIPAAFAADKPFKRDDLADAAIKLAAQIKADAGQVTKPAAALRREADAAFQRNDFRSGLNLLQQIVAVAPDDSASWLRLAKATLQSRPANDREKTQ